MTVYKPKVFTYYDLNTDITEKVVRLSDYEVLKSIYQKLQAETLEMTGFSRMSIQ